MLEFICGLFSLTCLSEKFDTAYSPVHTVAQPYVKRNLKVRIINDNKGKSSIYWGGHFSAKNFKTEDEKNKLKTIKSTLRKAVSALPIKQTSYLSDLIVSNQSHVSRGMANSHKMLINVGTIETNEELAAIFIHEMGHVVDLGQFKGHKWSDVSGFMDGDTPIYNDDPSLMFYQISWLNEKQKKIGVSRYDFVSGYSQTDPFEDFAEHYIFYRLHGEKFRNMMQRSDKLRQKYVFLKNNVFAGKEFQKQKPFVMPAKKDIWDTTLLTYDLRKDLILGY